MVDKKHSDLELILNYNFKNRDLLKLALTHSSFVNDITKNSRMNNERLEFLGDAVLKLVISEYLYLNNIDLDEGSMTKMRAHLISDKILAKVAKNLSLGNFLRLSVNEQKNGGVSRPSILGNALEALFGAIYLDSDLTNTSRIIEAIMLSELKKVKPDSCLDYKSTLQEIMQKSCSQLPKYKVIKEYGPDHSKTFEIICSIKLNNKELSVTAKGNTKKIAQQNCAQKLLEMINNETKAS